MGQRLSIRIGQHSHEIRKASQGLLVQREKLLLFDQHRGERLDGRLGWLVGFERIGFTATERRAHSRRRHRRGCGSEEGAPRYPRIAHRGKSASQPRGPGTGNLAGCTDRSGRDDRVVGRNDTRQLDMKEGRQVGAATAGSAATRDRLMTLVSPVVQVAGYDLEDLVLTPMGRRSLLRVVIDRDEGISLDDISAISHAVGKVLDDDEGVIGKAPYVLEVTSPGVDRPLTEARHWRRAIGRLVEVTAPSVRRPDEPDGSQSAPLRGRIVGVDEMAVTLDVAGIEQVVPLEELGPGRIQLEFNRPAEGAKRERPQRQPKANKGRAS